MGTNTIPSASDGTIIPAGDHNAIQEALSTDFVPRSVSGVPTAVIGSVGSSTYTWLSVFFGAVSAGLSLAESAGKMLLKVGGSTVTTIGSTGIEAGSFKALAIATADIANEAITKGKLKDITVNTAGADPGEGGISKDGVVSGNLNGTSGIIGSTILTTSGRPVAVFVESGVSSTTGADIQSVLAGNSIHIKVGATTYSESEISTARAANSFFTIADVSASTHTFDLYINNYTGNYVYYDDIRLVAFEL